MSDRDHSFNGARLKSARLYNGLTIAELADKINISKQAISQFENGQNEPRVSTLMNLINVLGFPRNYFFESEQKKRIGDTYFRALYSTSVREKMMQVERVKLLVSIYLGIDMFIEFPKLNLPCIPCENQIDVEKISATVRQVWGLGNNPIKNIIGVMEENGIIVNSQFLNSDKIDAYSQFEIVEDRRIALVILGSNKDSSYRRNFSAAHELGHLLLDDYYNIEDMSRADYKEMENTMNSFAGALLIPRDDYKQTLQTRMKTDLNFYIQLKKKYHVSAQALIVRAREIGELTQNQYLYLMKQISGKGYRSCEPYDKETPQINPRYIKEAMKMIIEEDGVSSGEFLEAVSSCGTTISEKIIENVIGLEQGYLNKNDPVADMIDFKLERK